MRSWSTGFFVLLLFFIPPETHAQSAPKAPVSAQKMAWVAHILRQTETPNLVGLNFFSRTVPVVLIPKEEELRPLVEFRYRFEREGWKISVQGEEGKLAGTEPFVYSVFAFLNSQISEITFTATGPNGEKESEVVYLFAPEAQEFQVVSTWNSLVGYFGVANLIYEQSRFGVLNAKSLLLGLNYLSADSSSRFGVLGNIQITAATFSSEPISANPQLVDGHLAGVMKLPFREETRWRYKAFVGASYTALLSNGSPFGFAALIAPEVGVIAQYYRNARTSFIIEGRAVLLENYALTKQRGLHAKLTLSETLKSARKQEWSLHLSTTNYESQGQQLAPHLIGFSLGYSF